MDDRIKALLKLQQIDLEVRDLEKAAAEYPSRLKEIDDDLGADRVASDANQAEHDELDKQRRTIEGQIQLQKDQIKKWEARLTEIKTPREYAALSREIDIAKKGLRNQEEEVLNLMEQGEALRNEVERIERTILEKESGYEDERSELKSKLAKLDAQKKDLLGRRENAASSVEKRLLSRYDLIRSRRAGLAMAEAQPGMTCGACRMRLPPQLYNEIVSGRAGVPQCPSCNRILYVAPEEDEAGAAEEASHS